MKDLPLSRTYEAGSEMFSVIKLRDPKYPDYREIGPAYEVQRGIVVRDREAIFAYVDRLITSPAAGALDVLELPDALALEEHILGFFAEARKLMVKLTSSSSGSAGSMKDLPLSRTYEAGSEMFSVIKLRDPKYPDYREIGPAYEVQRGIVVRDREAIFAYVDRLITSPAAGALDVLELPDALALEEHILGFFAEARKSMVKLTSSSSGSAGTPGTSTP